MRRALRYVAFEKDATLLLSGRIKMAADNFYVRHALVVEPKIWNGSFAAWKETGLAKPAPGGMEVGQLGTHRTGVAPRFQAGPKERLNHDILHR